MRIKAALAFLLMTALLLPAGSALAAGGGLALKDQMVPHKALYDIKMVSKKSGSQILNISGQMFYEWKPGCDAWITDHRFNLFYEYTDSPPIRITSDFSTYEPYDGKSFSFTAQRKRNGELYQEVRGNADIEPDAPGKVLYTMPADLTFDLSKGTLFPMAHSLEVLRLAQEGKAFYNATVFDGSDEDGPVEINTFIGKPVTPVIPVSTDGNIIDSELLSGKAWKIRMAFFPLKEGNTDAEYEMDVVFHENGVISDMLVEYRDFAVTQKLAALEKIQPEDCSAPADKGEEKTDKKALKKTGKPGREKDAGK